MRINSDLEKVLLNLEESNSNDGISLLDTVKALEKAYRRINESFLKDEKYFYWSNEKDYFNCKKIKHDPVLGKTIYNVYKLVDGEEVSMLDIEISHIGEVSFMLNGSNTTESEKLIEKLNEPSNELMEKIKMNADISFFTENRELMISKKPYLALKMGNFVEEDKAVLVYKEESNSNQINMVNSGLKYIRIDQIEGYLKNIKINERKIPTLAYAFIGNDYEQDYISDIYDANNSTYPKITEEKAEEYRSYSYQRNLYDSSTALSIGGGFIGGLISAIMSAIFPLPFIPSILIGVGIPVVASIGICYNGSKNIKQAKQKEERIKMAFINLYTSLKEYANSNIIALEKEFTKKREKENKKISSTKFENSSISELIRAMRKNLSQEDANKAAFCNIALAQILNAYLDKNVKKEEKIKNDSEFYGELIELGTMISELDTTPIIDVVNYTIDTVKRLIPKSNPNATIEILNNLYEARLYKTPNGIESGITSKWSKDNENCYFETFLVAASQENGISVQTVSSISPLILQNLINKLKTFADKINYSDVPLKRQAAIELRNELLSNEPQELKIIKSMKKIHQTSNLTYDLLGKTLTDEKVKVKENIQK